jgi:hypothetical protein
MQIDAQVIENLFIKNTNIKKHFSISFNFKTEINFGKLRWLVNSKLVPYTNSNVIILIRVLKLQVSKEYVILINMATCII